jgi:hypothetical protein
VALAEKRFAIMQNFMPSPMARLVEGILLVVKVQGHFRNGVAEGDTCISETSGMIPLRRT